MTLAVANDPIAQNFLKFAQMTPAQKMRARMLAALHLTEEDLQRMTAQQRKEVEDKIADMIKKQTQTTGRADESDFARMLKEL